MNGMALALESAVVRCIAMIVLRRRGIHDRQYEIERYAGPVTAIRLTFAAEGRKHSLRLLLRDDLRVFQEVGGGDELRIVDLAEPEPQTLKFGGQYRLEWWIEGKLSASFRLDSFEAEDTDANKSED